MFAKAIPDRLEPLAVATPSRVKLGKDILAVIQQNLIKRLADHDRHGLVLSLGDRLALELGLELAIEEELNHLVGSLSSYVLLLIVRVLELLREVLDDEAGPLGLAEVKCAGVVTVL